MQYNLKRIQARSLLFFSHQFHLKIAHHCALFWFLSFARLPTPSWDHNLPLATFTNNQFLRYTSLLLLQEARTQPHRVCTRKIISMPAMPLRRERELGILLHGMWSCGKTNTALFSLCSCLLTTTYQSYLVLPWFSYLIFILGGRNVKRSFAAADMLNDDEGDILKQRWVRCEELHCDARRSFQAPLSIFFLSCNIAGKCESSSRQWFSWRFSNKLDNNFTRRPFTSNECKLLLLLLVFMFCLFDCEILVIPFVTWSCQSIQPG